MDWTPDEVRALAEALKARADAGRLVVQALRFFAAESFGRRVEMLIVEASDYRNGSGLEVVGEASDMDAARALFDVMCRKRPESQVTLRKRGWVIGSKRPGELPPGSTG